MTLPWRASLILAFGPLAALQDGGDPVASLELHVTLVDSHGEALWLGWNVQLGRWTENELVWRQDQRVDHQTRSVIFVGLTDDEVLVRGVHSTGERTAHALARLGENGAVELRLDGPRPDESLFLTLIGVRGPKGELLPPARIVAIDGAGIEHELTPKAAQEWSYVARGIGAGRYRIEVRDPRYAPVLLDDAATGTPNSAVLRGSATLALRFLDPVDKRPVVAVNGLMWMTTSNGERSLYKGIDGPWWQAEGWGADPPPGNPRTPIGPDGVHHIESLMPGTALRVLATFGGHLEVELDTPAIAAGEVRAVDVQLTRGLEVLGRVVDEHGSPIAGAFILPIAPGRSNADTLREEDERLYGARQPVSLELSPASTELGEFQQLILRDLRSRATLSGPDGTFRIGGLALDTEHVLVSITPWDVMRVDVTRETTTPGAFPRATATAVVAHRGAADVQLRQNGPRNLAAYPHAFEYALRIGDGPWRTRREAARSLEDNDWCIRLRGLPLERSRLRVTPRLADGTVAPDAAGRIFEFTPAIDSPTHVEIDLSLLAPK